MADTGMTFFECVSKLNSALSTKGSYTPWISFTLGDLTVCNGDTNHNYFMSLNNIRNGSGQANQFSLVIAFVPNYAPGSSDSDPDMIDKMLSYAGLKKECTLQYGYSYPVDIKSPIYTGMVTDYTCELRQGMLYYTITGYSGIIAAKESLVSVPGKLNIRPTEAVKQVFNKYLQSSGYTFKFGESPKTEGTDNVVEKIDMANNISIFEYIDSTLKIARYSGDTEKTPVDEVSQYQYRVEDIKGKKIFWVERVSPKDLSRFDSSKNITFDWMSFDGNQKGKGNNLVIDFKTNFKGSALMALEDSDENTKYGLNEKGEPVKSYTIYASPTAGASAIDDSNTDKQNWSEATQYTYTATLTLIGVPAHIKITEVIKVNPLIYGRQHHTAGYYMVTKIEDNIDASGFITTLSLAKIKLDDENTTK